jgi:RHS repeat-associated protein
LTSAGVITNSPTTGGIYPFTVTAANGVNPNATQSFTATVYTPPLFTSGASTTFTVGSAGSFPLTATGYPAAAYTVAPWTPLPTWLTLSSSGLLSGTPPTGSDGVYHFVFAAHNILGDASQSFTLTVTTGGPPPHGPIGPLTPTVPTVTTVAWYLPDHVLTVRALTDSTGVLQDRITYNPYGVIVSQTNPAYLGQFAFQGGAENIVTGMTEFGDRWMNGIIWVSQDPEGTAAGPNLYEPLGNDPTNNVDPTGLDWNRQTDAQLVLDTARAYDPKAFAYANSHRMALVAQEHWTWSRAYTEDVKGADGGIDKHIAVSTWVSIPEAALAFLDQVKANGGADLERYRRSNLINFAPKPAKPAPAPEWTPPADPPTYGPPPSSGQIDYNKLGKSSCEPSAESTSNLPSLTSNSVRWTPVDYEGDGEPAWTKPRTWARWWDATWREAGKSWDATYREAANQASCESWARSERQQKEIGGVEGWWVGAKPFMNDQAAGKLPEGALKKAQLPESVSGRDEYYTLNVENQRLLLRHFAEKYYLVDSIPNRATLISDESLYQQYERNWRGRALMYTDAALHVTASLLPMGSTALLLAEKHGQVDQEVLKTALFDVAMTLPMLGAGAKTAGALANAKALVNAGKAIAAVGIVANLGAATVPVSEMISAISSNNYTWGQIAAYGAQTVLFLLNARSSLITAKQCFPAGTPVRTPQGEAAIETLRKGDWVVARPEGDVGEAVAPCRIEAVHVREGKVIRIGAASQVFRVTPDHPIYARGRGWVAAGSLREGDELSGEDGGWLRVEGVRDAGEVERVYNLTVADYHTYFVGSRAWGFAVWVHNASSAYLDALAKELAQTLEKTEVENVERILARSAAEGDVHANNALGILFEAKARTVMAEAGETVIVSQRPRGAVRLGFDFLTVEGTGAEAKLIINEAKGVEGAVVATDFGPFGLGRNAANGGENTLNNSLKFAEDAINNAGIDKATKRALIQQLRDKTASVRIIGRDTTVMSQEVMVQITAKSGFKVLPEVKKLP